MFQEEGFVSAPLVTVAEAARYLGVGRKVIYQLIEWGELRAVKVNSVVHVEKKTLDDFKNSGKMT